MTKRQLLPAGLDMISFDFQQNLPTPNLHHNDVFYARQLWTYNFGIHDCVADKGYMYMWDETIAKHGSAEVASSAFLSGLPHGC